jgi:hypothetical protein
VLVCLGFFSAGSTSSFLLGTTPYEVGLMSQRWVRLTEDNPLILSLAHDPLVRLGGEKERGGNSAC